MAAVGAAAIAVAAVADPTTIEDGPVICPFRLVTGLPCPGCGLIRSWVHLVHGDWSASLTANPFGVVAMAATIVLLTATGGAVAKRRRVPSIDGVFRSRTFAVVAALWIAFGVVRLGAVLAGATTV